MNGIQPLDFLLKQGESVLLMVPGILSTIIFLDAHLFSAPTSFLVLTSTLVADLVVLVLQSLNFLKQPFDGMEIVNHFVLRII